MKKLKKLKLNQLRDANLSNDEMSSLVGGRSCTCSCDYYGYGGSSTADNKMANYNIGSGGGSSTTGCNQSGYHDDYGNDFCEHCSA